MTRREKDKLKALLLQIKEKVGNLTLFCAVYNYEYTSMKYLFSRKAKNLDPALYAVMKRQVENHKVTINQDLVLLEKVISELGGHETFCQMASIKHIKLLEVINIGNTTSTEFIKVAYQAYRIYLQDKLGMTEYISSMAPAKYLTGRERFKRNMSDLGIK